MNFRIQCVHKSAPDKTPLLFATIRLPDFIVVYGKSIERNNEGIPEEIVKALNDAEMRDCIFSIGPKGNHSAAMQEYWKRRKLREKEK